MANNSGLKITRKYTSPGDPYKGIVWEKRTSKITNPDGSIVFEMNDVEIPSTWSQVATDIMVSKYFRKAGVPQVDVNGKELKDENGDVTAIYCTYDPTTKGGWSDDGRKVRGTLHWVSAKHAVDAEVRFYDHLFNVENPETDGDDFIQYLNPNSLIKTSEVKLEIGLQGAAIGTNYQFLRNGYFCLDLDSTEEKLIFNRTVGLRDSWSKKLN